MGVRGLGLGADRGVRDCVGPAEGRRCVRRSPRERTGPSRPLSTRGPGVINRLGEEGDPKSASQGNTGSRGGTRSPDVERLIQVPSPLWVKRLTKKLQCRSPDCVERGRSPARRKVRGRGARGPGNYTSTSSSDRCGLEANVLSTWVGSYQRRGKPYVKHIVIDLVYYQNRTNTTVRVNPDTLYFPS